jgi:DNA-binding NarL/FixJ family response regulator
LKASIVRVVIVDDNEPFRRFTRSTLAKMQNFQVIGEASDGLEAVHKVQELKPDLIVLDIGLPSLNGIEVTRQIRKSCPECRILIMSQGSSVDVAQEAFSLGAVGYVVKSHAGRELSIAVGTVCQGRRFVSAGLPSHNWAGATDANDNSRQQGVRSEISKKVGSTHSHVLELYADDEALLRGLTGWVEAALNARGPIFAIVTEPHRASLLARLQARGVGIAAAIDQGLFVMMDVDLALSAFMVNDLPDPIRLRNLLGDLVSAASEAASSGNPRVVVFGEIAPTLWARGQAEAALQLEHLTDEFARTQNVDILCGYVSDSFPHEQAGIYEAICSQHTAALAQSSG